MTALVRRLVPVNVGFQEADGPRKVCSGSSALVAANVGYRVAKLADEGRLRVMSYGSGATIWQDRRLTAAGLGRMSGSSKSRSLRLFSFALASDRG
jgi:hypothetical protein